jgi:hypothetical protein
MVYTFPKIYEKLLPMVREPGIINMMWVCNSPEEKINLVINDPSEWHKLNKFPREFLDMFEYSVLKSYHDMARYLLSIDDSLREKLDLEMILNTILEEPEMEALRNAIIPDDVDWEESIEVYPRLMHFMFDRSARYKKILKRIPDDSPVKQLYLSLL